MPARTAVEDRRVKQDVCGGNTKLRIVQRIDYRLRRAVSSTIRCLYALSPSAEHRYLILSATYAPASHLHILVRSCLFRLQSLQDSVPALSPRFGIWSEECEESANWLQRSDVFSFSPTRAIACLALSKQFGSSMPSSSLPSSLLLIAAQRLDRRKKRTYAALAREWNSIAALFPSRAHGSAIGQYADLVPARRCNSPECSWEVHPRTGRTSRHVGQSGDRSDGSVHECRGADLRVAGLGAWLAWLKAASPQNVFPHPQLLAPSSAVHFLLIAHHRFLQLSIGYLFTPPQNAGPRSLQL
ncbi:hypothetical protein L226DRAFT_164998 [Lentinus tigrinus ALCF2SS1-7]|uniref:Uncharacterized protein n=1 Tax=Lentinus tigrinus ALCF2SS1-6 TaxID=1328759 RepID=A0A5C2S491_9APHY|nr:hypothetical protein L227DRAFT_222041 [Lentinus tigrinus ALCF2SS1-6]RPD71910.1 hypothetical protein L226DRAFT_164998 [Lentinus tigrinus ALCF2SS1-7]